MILVLSGCAVREATPEGITIEHNARQTLPAEQRASRHCAQFGKRAVLQEQTLPAPSPGFLYTVTQTSTYACVD